MQITIDLTVAMTEALRAIASEHKEATSEDVRLTAVAKVMLANALVRHGYISSLKEAMKE